MVRPKRFINSEVLYTLLVLDIITGYIKQIPARVERESAGDVSDGTVLPVITPHIILESGELATTQT